MSSRPSWVTKTTPSEPSVGCSSVAPLHFPLTKWFPIKSIPDAWYKAIDKKIKSISEGERLYFKDFRSIAGQGYISPHFFEEFPPYQSCVGKRLNRFEYGECYSKMRSGNTKRSSSSSGRKLSMPTIRRLKAALPYSSKTRRSTPRTKESTSRFTHPMEYNRAIWTMAHIGSKCLATRTKSCLFWRLW